VLYPGGGVLSDDPGCWNNCPGRIRNAAVDRPPKRLCVSPRPECKINK